MTFLAALRCDQVTAPCVFDGPINGECFLLYVEQVLVLSLKPGDMPRHFPRRLLFRRLDARPEAVGLF